MAQKSEAWLRGERDYRDGRTLSQNPYSASDRQHRQWVAAWHETRAAIGVPLLLKGVHLRPDGHGLYVETNRDLDATEFMYLDNVIRKTFGNM